MAPNPEKLAQLRAQIAAIESGAHPTPRAPQGSSIPQASLDNTRVDVTTPGSCSRAEQENLQANVSTCSVTYKTQEKFSVVQHAGIYGSSSGAPLDNALVDDDERGATSEAQGNPSEEAEQAFRKIERVAMRREQSTVGLRRRLLRDGFSEVATETALTRAQACGLIDDQRFADVLVRSRLSQGRGRRGIQAELADLAIDVDMVREWQETEPSDESSEVDRALTLLTQRPPRAKNQRDAAYRRLMQKGFSSSVASTAARQWVENSPQA